MMVIVGQYMFFVYGRFFFKISLMDLEVQLHPTKLSTNLQLRFYFLRYRLLKFLAMLLKFLQLLLNIVSPKELGRSQNMDLELKEISNHIFLKISAFEKKNDRDLYFKKKIDNIK